MGHVSSKSIFYNLIKPRRVRKKWLLTWLITIFIMAFIGFLIKLLKSSFLKTNYPTC